MSSVVISGDTSGAITVAAPAVSGTNTQTLVAATGTLAPLISATAQASTSGTSITFTGIPSWVKRITLMFNGVSTNGTSNPLIQLGSGSVTTTGYSAATTNTATTASLNYTTGFGIGNGSTAAATLFGSVSITNVSGNIWVASGTLGRGDAASLAVLGGGITLSGTLDRVVLTTVNGTDAFDAGSINILYE